MGGKGSKNFPAAMSQYGSFRVTAPTSEEKEKGPMGLSNAPLDRRHTKRPCNPAPNSGSHRFPVRRSIERPYEGLSSARSKVYRAPARRSVERPLEGLSYSRCLFCRIHTLLMRLPRVASGLPGGIRMMTGTVPAKLENKVNAGREPSGNKAGGKPPCFPPA
jgi:hypothetical protein